jgi:hypothetical protein
MKKTTQLLLILIYCLAITACVPQSTSSGKRKTSDSATTSTDDSDTTTSTVYGGDVQWYNSQYVSGTVSINSNTKSVIYLRGDGIHNFLSQENNIEDTYCLVTSYNESNATANNLYKVRAIPLAITNHTTQSTENLLKIDLVATTANTSHCQGGVPDALVTGDAFDPTTVCSGCSGIITSTSVELYRTDGTSSNLTEIETSQLDLTSLGLRIDIQSNYTNPGSSCTDSECTAKNFDCCLDGQCVNSGAQKSNPDANDLAQALADVATNPANFINWPSVYYICANTSNPEPTPTALPDAQATADAEFAAKQEQYNCLTLGDEDLTTRSFVNCNANSAYGYQETRRAVWSLCGCAHTFDVIDSVNPDDSDGPSPYCPDYGLEELKDSTGTVVDYICSVPAINPQPTPIQSLDVAISGRMAPHRFFKDDGTNYDSLESLKIEYEAALAANASTTKPMQEGEEFYYLDESGKTNPISGTFNMNSVLGQMAVELDKTHPAKMLDVEYDQTYVITSKSGYYTPCPTCATDYWFNTFKPYPAAEALKPGQGLVATGATTSRMSDNYNASLGNYEDTIFGRACWLPPTMVPFSHQPNADLQTQRQNRLSTQAALYINGYQRDWFGFNKGAVIGSFDGVNWFAIGRGRRITATSSKLFIAINAPFADLSENTDTVVHVATDLGGNTVADYDYDPDIAVNSATQTGGASCQQYHQCEVDSDCVTNLGWEYTCADVSDYKTYLPKFDAESNETASSEIADATFSQIITGGYTGSSKKRCVYRGAGSPCKVSYSSGGLNSNTQELLRCAPNFYCAALASSDYNQELVRTPSEVNLINLGQDADILGRPKSYLGSTGTGVLSTEIISNITYNAALYFNKDTSSSDAQDFGVCRPGKDLTSSTWELQHSSKDSGLRTDYISQIGSCDSGATGTDRIRTCPTFDSNGDYTFPSSGYSDTSIQNSCGLESQKEIAASVYESSFKDIEAGILSSLSSLIAPSYKVAADACYRRAGSVCHTDLDCSPGALHAKETLLQDRFSFGDTTAEYNYWSESLICGQADRKPATAAQDDKTYDISKNLCCREIGSDITIFTAGADETLNTGITNSTDLNPTYMSSHAGTETGRYSRYLVVDGIENKASMLSSQTAYAQVPRIDSATTPIAFQWKAINDSGKRTCCGGGFIRKFTDSLNDWSRSDRLLMDPSAFSCINYTTSLPFEEPANIDSDNYNFGYSRLCQSPADNHGCVQQTIPQASGFEIQSPTDLTTTTFVLNTTPDEDPTDNLSVTQINNLSVDIPYMPVAYKNPLEMSATSGPFNFLSEPIFSHGASFYIPSYITATTANLYTNISSVAIDYYKDGNITQTTTMTTGSGQLLNACTDLSGNGSWDNPVEDLIHETACISTDSTGTYQVMHVRGDPDFDDDGTNDWDYAGLRITFTAQNSATHTPAPNSTPMSPGNDLYYLTKLARFELTGIPQIVYEPLYCNDQKDKLVEGIFNVSDQTRTGFEAGTNSFQYDNSINGREITEIYETQTSTTDDANTNGHVVQMDKLNFSPIFKSNEFMCCMELGTETSDATQCCSGFAKDDETTGVKTCKLPKGANLNVYFNRFISGDGVGDTQPGGGLIDDDFVPETGEPKMRQSTYDKISALGGEYCENGTTRSGATFGEYNAEPNNNSYTQVGSLEDSKFYSILDSSKDEDSNTESGMQKFVEGYRWDHHVYCN